MPIEPSKRYKSLWQTKGGYLDKDVAIKIAPAPLGGLDAISPLAAMEPKYASILTNWTPRPTWIELRGGYNAWAQGLGASGPVESLMTYRPNTGAERLFAASGSLIQEITTYGTVSTAVSGLTNARWQWVNFTPAQGNNFLLAVNGQDAYQAFNGTSWSQPVVTGVNGANLIHINIFKRRVWFVQANSTSVWFTTTDGIQGALTQLDVGAFMDRGGFLMAMATWTVDGGQGPDDLAVFISSKGQMIIYKGTDPTNANAWSLVGVFNLAPPIGRRCFVKLGSDVLLITLEGVIPLGQVLPFDPSAARNVALTNRIQNLFFTYAQSFNTNFGWEVFPFRLENLIMVNIPQVQGSTQVQLVQNALTGAWGQYSGWNANCFGIFNESLFFGDNKGNVNLAYTGGLDGVNSIASDLRCAFNYFEEPGRLKTATMVRPFLVSDGTITPTISIDVDFATGSPVAPVTSLQPVGAIWDTSLWDQSVWSTGTINVINWLSATALGTALAIRMNINLSGGGNTSTVASQSVFDTGLFDSMLFDGNGNITSSGLGIPTLQINTFEVALKYGGPV